MRGPVLPRTPDGAVQSALSGSSTLIPKDSFKKHFANLLPADLVLWIRIRSGQELLAGSGFIDSGSADKLQFSVAKIA